MRIFDNHWVRVLTLAVALSACAARTAPQGVAVTVHARVEAALATARDVDATNLSVEVIDGIVTVMGRVTSGFEQQSVGAIVRAVPGVTEVRFVMQVDDPQAGR